MRRTLKEPLNAIARKLMHERGIPWKQALELAAREMKCGARTMAGTPCQRKALWPKRRCSKHGGCSTGPTTPEGKALSLAALARGRARWAQIRAARKQAAHQAQTMGENSDA